MRDIFHPKEAKKKVIDTREELRNKKSKILSNVEVRNFTISSKKKGSFSLLKFFALLVLVLIVGLGVYYLLIINKDNSSQEQNKSEIEAEELRIIDQSLDGLDESIEALSDPSESEDVPVIDLNVNL